MEILDDVVDIATRAVDRLCVKLEKIRGTGREIELAEEFRLLTLQVIGEAILSLCGGVGRGDAKLVFADYGGV